MYKVSKKDTLQGFIKDRLQYIVVEERKIIFERNRLNAALNSIQGSEQEYSYKSTYAKKRLYRGEGETIKEKIKKILINHTNGLNCADILIRLNENSPKIYARTSLSPQLSRLRQDGIINLNRGIWTYVIDNSKGRKEVKE